MPQSQRRYSHSPNIDGLLALATRRESQEEDILNRFEDLPDNDNNEPMGHLYTSLQEASISSQTWIDLTNFSQNHFHDLFREVDSIASTQLHSQRGKKPAVSTADALLALLILYKTAPKLDELGEKVKYYPTALRNALDRIRPILNTVLQNRWWKDRIRPFPLVDTRFNWIGLLVDVNSQEVFKPKGRFEEAKIYWDQKNYIYALKREVSVTAAPPHFALFVSKGRVGSTHDFTLHKEVYREYLPYLRKTNQEITMVPEDRSARTWGILGDKAYFANSEETPDERRIAIKKGARTMEEKVANKELSLIRVPVEQFFGRMWKLWSLLRKPYPFSHSYSDVDFENMVLLTNEHIQATTLDEADQTFYRAIWEDRKRIYEEKANKRRDQVASYLTRRKRRYQEAFQK
jgi:hypothetical protein